MENITVEQLKNWLGSDNVDSQTLLTTIVELINGGTDIQENFRQDVLNYE